MKGKGKMSVLTILIQCYTESLSIKWQEEEIKGIQIRRKLKDPTCCN